MNERDHLTTMRELLRDAIEVARTAAVSTDDPAAGAVWERGRAGVAAVLVEFDDFASRPDRPKTA